MVFSAEAPAGDIFQDGIRSSLSFLKANHFQRAIFEKPLNQRKGYFWVRTNVDIVKINTDAAINFKADKSDVGLIVRECNGIVLSATISLGFCSPLFTGPCILYKQIAKITGKSGIKRTKLLDN